MKPDSVLARTAREMVEAHAGGAGPREGMTTCPVCGEPLPCSSGRAAAEVLFAAGLAESSGLVAAYQQGLGSPLGLPPEPGPRAGASPFPAEADAEAPEVSFAEPALFEPDVFEPSAFEPPLFEPSGRSPDASDGAGPDVPPAAQTPDLGDGASDSAEGDFARADEGSGFMEGAFGAADEASGFAESDPVGEPQDAEPDSTAPDDQDPDREPDDQDPDEQEPDDQDPGGLSSTGSAALPPSRWTPSRKAARASAVRTSKAPPPAETARGIARPVVERATPQPVAEPEPEIDPLLLGPPLFVEQNRPLDAPRFPRTPRLAEPIAITEDPPSAPQPAPPEVVNAPAAPDPSRAGGWPAPADSLAPIGPDHPAGLTHPGVPDHPGEPGHPGVLDHPAEPRPPARPAPSAGRAPLEAPQMGQLNRGLTTGAEPPAIEPGRQTTTARQARPPLEAPQLGQLNRPLEPPIGDRPGGTGLPAAPAGPAGDPRAEDRPAPWAEGQDETGTPSGLLSAPATRPETREAGPSTEEDIPSGLPSRTEPS